ncbi:MAG: (2Fe-2S)-binding protein [Deltaproteobacteria bacterium]|nr:(2Fe-2S)-binding protein [Deltaproteobacteria bacterium]
MKREISFRVNGAEATAVAGGGDRLIDVLREGLGLTGTKEGCGEGECGACTVIVDGRAVNACLYPAAEIDGREVTTVEGLTGPDSTLGPIQRAFVECGAVQCGFCTPGMIMSTKALLDGNPDPSDEEVRDALLGNLCRCTGYVQIVEAVRRAAVAGRDR